jgi:DNA-binding NarL/FixJ family response regulator
MQDLAQFTVLVAHSSEYARERLRAGLEKLPEWSVQEAASGGSALELFFRHRPAVVLVDVCLPECNGFEIIRCITQAAPECAVVLLTHSRDPFVEKVGQLLGATRVCSETDEPGYVRDLLQTCSAQNK